MPRTIAIGDIHGCSKTFLNLLEEIDIAEDDNVYLLGDYIDRGPDSKGVIDTILALQQKNYQVHTLRGNHEQMMLESGDGFEAFAGWVANGGEKTLESFLADSFDELNPVYKNFFLQTKHFLANEHVIFAHAGLNFDNENILEDMEAMLWIRNENDNQPTLGNRRLIHGHTPKPLEYILSQKGNCINLDAGCVYAAKKPAMGYLVALILETNEFIYVKNCE